jgi:hypothetical protein
LGELKAGHGQEVPQLDEQLEKALVQVEQSIDLEGLAQQSGALIRHRGISSAAALLRIVLGYSVQDWSLRLLGAWCVVLGLADISKTALLNRLRHCRRWVGMLVVAVLMRQRLHWPAGLRLRVKLFDASVVCQPGSQGADWRLHVGFDLGRACLDWIELTDGHGGESLTRFSFAPGDLAIADRYYASRKNVGYVLSQGAWLLVRVGWLKLPFETETGQPFDLFAWLKQAPLSPASSAQEVSVWVSTPQGRFALRLLAQTLPKEAAEKARSRMRKEAQKKGKTVDQRSLFAAGFILLATNLPAADWSLQQVLLLYRFRWQVELAFKRLKSLLKLDGLRTKNPELAQVYLLTKLLAALLLERIQLDLAAQYPDWFVSQERPLSLWRLTSLLWDEFRYWLRGPITLTQILAAFPRLRRFLCDEPRKRVSQRASAQSLFSGLCAG